MFDKIKKNYFILIITFLFIYFFFNLLGGDRGLISYLKKKEIYEELKIKQTDLNFKIQDLEHKNSLLTENIDLDFIEILIRDKFLFGKDGETTYIIKQEWTKLNQDTLKKLKIQLIQLKRNQNGLDLNYQIVKNFF